MPSLALFARLVARAIGGTEAETLFYNSLSRLSTSSSIRHLQTLNRPAVPSSPHITRAVRLITAASGYSGHHDDDIDNKKQYSKEAKNSPQIHRMNRSNAYGDDAFFIAKNRLGDFLGMMIDLSINKRF